MVERESLAIGWWGLNLFLPCAVCIELRVNVDSVEVIDEQYTLGVELKKIRFN